MSVRVLGAFVISVSSVLHVTSPPAAAQSKPAETRPGETRPAKGATFKPEELEQLVAPLALHPDSLLSQILMASTYPLEVIEAARWVKANATLKGDALATALEKQDWDPSVRSLVNFPDVLQMMDQKLDWMQKLGDAVLAQQKEVLDAVQRLRKKAKDAGNLETTKEQKVTQAPNTEYIVIEPANPQVVYVPSYNPTVVYGAWPYPAYPPYYYYPPGYAAGAAFSFMAGVAIGVAWGYAWGGCGWGHGHSEINIDVNRNTNINRNIDRGKYQDRMAGGDRGRGQGAGDRAAPGAGDRAAPGGGPAGGRGQGSWQHDPSHRKGASYRDQATAQRYNKAGTSDRAAREQFRGYADQGRQNLGKDGPGAGQRPAGGGPAAGNRPSAGTGARSTGTTKQGAFDSYGRGSDASSQRSRGQTSRQTSSSSRVRSSGGGARGGGGRAGGGGRGGGGRR